MRSDFARAIEGICTDCDRLLERTETGGYCPVCDHLIRAFTATDATPGWGPGDHVVTWMTRLHPDHPHYQAPEILRSNGLTPE